MPRWYLDNAVVSDTGTGVILPPAAAPELFSDMVRDIFGGTLKTVGSGAELVMSASNLLSGVTIAASSFVEIASGGTQELIKVTIGAGATVEVASGGVGCRFDFGTIGAGAIVDALNGSVMSLTGVHRQFRDPRRYGIGARDLQCPRHRHQRRHDEVDGERRPRYRRRRTQQFQDHRGARQRRYGAHPKRYLWRRRTF